MKSEAKNSKDLLKDIAMYFEVMSRVHWKEAVKGKKKKEAAENVTKAVIWQEAAHFVWGLQEEA